MRNRLILISILLFGCSAFSQTTTISGTIKDLTNTAVSSGKVVFTLKPSVDTTISGNARFTPGAPITCYIQPNGTLLNAAQSAACIVTSNTSLTPAGTSYRVDICPYMACASSFNFYAINSSYDISTIVPTPTTGPAQNFADVFSNQTIAGNKTFTGNTVFSGGTFTVFGACQIANVFYIIAGCYAGADLGAQITTALAGMPATGGTIVVPHGSYNQSTTVSITTQLPVSIFCGDGATITWTGSSSGIGYIWDNGTFFPTASGMQGCKLIGPGSGTSFVWAQLGAINGTLGLFFTKNSIQSAGKAFQCPSGGNCQNSKFDFNIFKSNGIDISVEALEENIEVNYNTFSGSGEQISITAGGTDLYAAGNSFDDYTGTAAVYVSNVNGVMVKLGSNHYENIGGGGDNYVEFDGPSNSRLQIEGGNWNDDRTSSCSSNFGQMIKFGGFILSVTGFPSMFSNGCVNTQAINITNLGAFVHADTTLIGTFTSIHNASYTGTGYFTDIADFGALGSVWTGGALLSAPIISTGGTALLLSGAGLPATIHPTCPVGSLYTNTSASSQATVLYMCWPANTWVSH